MTEIFLITDKDAAVEQTAARLRATLAQRPASALLVTAGAGEDADYIAKVSALAPIAQEHDCAVLLDNRPDLVKKAGADGVHMSGGAKALREAVESLKPDYIVGTGDIGSRHEAMVRGELEVDYLMFGDRDEPELDGREMADWWAETFEIPSVFFVPPHTEAPLAPVGSEFVALLEADWERAAALVGEPQ